MKESIGGSRRFSRLCIDILCELWILIISMTSKPNNLINFTGIAIRISLWAYIRSKLAEIDFKI
jgi:hypothetical protein